MWKIVLALVLLAAAFGGGFYTGKGATQVQTVEKIVYKEGKETVVFKDRIVTVTKVVSKDGTITETTKTEEKSKDTTKDTTIVSKDDEKTVTPVLSNYSLGVRYHAKYGALWQDVTSPQANSMELVVGRRLLGDVWIDLGASTRDVSLGVRFDF